MIPFRRIRMNGDFRDPRDTRLQRWWLRWGMLVAWSAMLAGAGLMVWSTLDTSHPHQEDATRGWAVLVGVVSAMMFADCIGQRVIVRLTQIIALFASDVAPQQPGSAGVAKDRPATVTELYRAEVSTKRQQRDEGPGRSDD